MYCAHSQACEDETVSFNNTSATTNFKGPKTVDSDRSEEWFVGNQAILRQVSHFLFTKRRLTSTTTVSVREGSSYCRICVNNPVFLTNQAKYVLSSRMYRIRPSTTIGSSFRRQLLFLTFSDLLSELTSLKWCN